MTAKWVGVSLLVGVFLLDCARGECNLTAVTSCIDVNLNQPGVMAELSHFDSSTTYTTFKTNCEALNTTTDCIKTATTNCTGSDLIEATSTLDSVERNVKDYCSKDMKCMAKRNTCFVAQPDLNTYLTSGLTSFNKAYCPATLILDTCLKANLHSRCYLGKRVQDGTDRLHLPINYCKENGCSSLQACQDTFNQGGPRAEGLDMKTCSLFGNYSACVNDSLSACSLASPFGQPSPAEISALVHEGCTLFAEDSPEVLYSCAAFTACINSVMGARNPFSPLNLCKTFQGVVGCVSSKAKTCFGTTSAIAAKLMDKSKQLALKGSAMGCSTIVYPGLCTGLDACKMHLLPLMEVSSSFGAKCSGVGDFQSCAFGAIENCNLTEERDPMGHERPQLDRMSDLTGQLCDAIAGQNVSTCKEYLVCVNSPVFRPMSDGELINAASWCESSVVSVACVMYFREECEVPAALVTVAQDLYDQLIDAGCEDLYDYESPEVIPTTTSPTGGSPSLFSVSLISLLLLALSSKMARLH